MRNGLGAARVIVIALCLLGVTVFGVLLGYLRYAPLDFEQRAQSFIASEIKDDLSQGLMARLEPKFGAIPGALSDQIDQLQDKVKLGMPRFIAATIAAMCRFECRDRDELEAALVKTYEEEFSLLKPGFEKLRGMVEGRYHAVFAELRRDFTIFLATNLVVLTFALGLALFNGKSARHLLPIAGVLTISTGLASYWYVFAQDWVWTIIFSNYFGWSYLVFLGAISLLLADVAFNRARVTSEIFNVVAHSLELSGSWAPC